MNKIKNVINKIEKLYKPKSIFIFGSRARGDYLKNSDYEIGVLFIRKNHIDENKLNNVIKPPTNIHIYPYEYEKFVSGRINIPFQVNIFLREIILSGKTLLGEKIIERIPPPSITVMDVKEDIKFSLARGSDAIVSYRNNDRKTASILFYKSCLFGTRDLIILLFKKFPKSYLRIYKLSKNLDLKDYKKVIHSACRVRNKGPLRLNYLLLNMSYLTKFVEKKINVYYKKWGNKILIK